MGEFGEKKLGFGCMRLPKKNEKEIDDAVFSEMADRFIAEGFCYFDTAHGYHDGESERALKRCVTDRHDREEYLIANKLSNSFFRSEKGIRPFFESQLKAVGTDYFDFYLMHAQNRIFYAKYRACNAYETAFRLKEEGKIRHVGLSFHDRAHVLDRILTDYPELEFVQIQFNYLDYYSFAVQGKQCYEICRKHGKPIVVMEPVKGGTLANLPAEGEKRLARLGTGSPASYALRYAAGFEGVEMVLSGMSNPAQLEDNLAVFKQLKPLDAEERAGVEEVSALLRGMKVVPCTACRYCTAGCPKEISIPDWFTRYNRLKLSMETGEAPKGGTPLDCVECGKCESICPQGLPIRKLLKKSAKAFDLTRK